MIRGRSFAAALLVLFTLTGCGTVHLEPPPPPPKHLPAEAELARPAPPDTSRVFVTTDVPARVILAVGGEIVSEGHAAYVPSGTVLCRSTPCTITVPRGEYELKFAGLEDSDRESYLWIQAERPDEVVNHHLGKYRTSTAKPLGVVALIGGIAALATSMILTKGFASTHTTTGLTMLGLVGGTSVAFGGALFIASPTYRQEGSTTQWSPSDPPGPVGRTISTGVGLRF